MAKTMKVRMAVGMSGTRNGEDWPPLGGLLECSEAEGRQLIDGGLAVDATSDEERTETAVAPPAEQRGGLTTENVPTKGAKTSAKK